MTDPDYYGWRARIEADWPMGGVAVILALRIPDGNRLVTRLGGEGFDRMETVDILNHEAFPTPTPALRMPEDAARALYDALAQHFAGETGSRQTRADLLHERGRVDKLIQVVSQVATGRAGGAQ